MAAAMAGRLLLLAAVALLHSTPAAAAAPQNNNTEFIRRRCSSTLYPSLCYASLASYAEAVAQDPTKLARVAANVSLARVHSVYSYVYSLRRGAGGKGLDVRTASALRDCEESLCDAADQTGQASAELGRIPTAVGPEVAWRVSNAQTWLSAALTNEDTCTDGLAESGSGTAVRVDVTRRVRQSEQYTSNALALVNGLVGTNR